MPRYVHNLTRTRPSLPRRFPTALPPLIIAIALEAQQLPSMGDAADAESESESRRYCLYERLNPTVRGTLTAYRNRSGTSSDTSCSRAVREIRFKRFRPKSESSEFECRKVN
jgi:hypothetical protein